MAAKRRFLVVDQLDEGQALGSWPWLRLVPGSWRMRAAARARPRFGPVCATGNRLIEGRQLQIMALTPERRLLESLSPGKGEQAPDVHAWTGETPPVVPGFAWHTGRIFSLLNLIAPFHPGLGTSGRSSCHDLTLLVVGGPLPETSVAARYLAGMAGRLILSHPIKPFRDRLAWQIWTESGLAVITPSRPPEDGWDLALDLRTFPPAYHDGRRAIFPRLIFPDPLRWPPGAEPSERAYPIWAECHLACLVPPELSPLPAPLTLAAIQLALALAEKAGLIAAFA